jgi:hypothetical protein
VTPPRRRSGRARRWLVAVTAVVVATLSLAGCGGVIGSVVSTETDIRNAGYSSVKVGLTDSDTNVSVSATSSSPPPTSADIKEIAGIVWHGFHLRFNELTVKVNGGGQSTERSFTFAGLQQLFGTRNPSYNKTSLRQSLEHFGIVIVIVAGVVVVLVVVLIVWIVRRRRKRRLAAIGPWGQGYGAGQGQGQAYGPGPAQGDRPGAPAGPPAWGPTPGYGGPPASTGYHGPPATAPPSSQVEPNGEGKGKPPSGPPPPGPEETDPWGRPHPPAWSGGDEPGSGWDPPPRSGWHTPPEEQAGPGAPPPSSGWGDDEASPPR